jgi:hypothetical protein
MPNENINVNALNTESMINNIIQTTFASTITKILSNKENLFSFWNLFSLIVILLLPDIKQGFMYIIRISKNYLINKLSFLYNIIANYKYSYENIDSVNDDLNYQYQNVKLKNVNLEIISGLMEFIDRGNFSYHSSIKTINASTIGGSSYKESVADINFKLGNMHVELLNDLILMKNPENQIIDLYEEIIDTQETDKVKPLPLPDMDNKCFLKTKYISDGLLSSDEFKNLNNNFNYNNIIYGSRVSVGSIIKELTINLGIEKKISKFDRDNLSKIFVIYYLLNKRTKKKFMFDKESLFFQGINISIGINNSHVYGSWNMEKCIFKFEPDLIPHLNQYHAIVDRLQKKFFIEETEEREVSTLMFKVLDFDTQQDKVILGEKFYKLFNTNILEPYIKKYNSKFKKRNIFNIGFSTITNKILVSKKNTNSKPQPKDKACESEVEDLQALETLQAVEEYHRVLKCTKVATQYKSFDTLYLREDDKFRLKNMLNNFLKSDDIYDQLGIRKKLGVMLHGEPGTGKSTTITAIASYLMRDIYYVNLKGITKNSELQEIFDYVRKNGFNKGIIVIEEIEKQTPIVFKNSEMAEKFNFNKSENELDLSYLLNLLDGTISQENSVFVMTTNHINLLEPALFRSGRVDVNMKFKKCDNYQINAIYNTIMKRKLGPEILNKIPVDTFTPADIIFNILPFLYETDMTDEKIMEQFFV